MGAGLRDPLGRYEIKSKVRPFLCRTTGPVTVPQLSLPCRGTAARARHALWDES